MKSFLIFFVFMTSLSTQALEREEAQLPLNTAYKIYHRENATKVDCPKLQTRGDLLQLVKALKERNENNLVAQEEAEGFLGLYETDVVRVREGHYFWSGRPYLTLSVRTLEDLYEGGTQETYYWSCEYSGL